MVLLPPAPLPVPLLLVVPALLPALGAPSLAR
jgi:hypothetical protein